MRCIICGADLPKGNSKYCSNECRKKYLQQYSTRICSVCHIEFNAPNHYGSRCKSCYRERFDKKKITKENMFDEYEAAKRKAEKQCVHLSYGKYMALKDQFIKEVL